MKHLTVKPTNMDEQNKGTFITVEGIDGSGTTTVVDAIAERFPDVVTTSEPAEQHWTGRATRQAINDGETHPMTDFHFFIGDRAYHLENTVWPALDRGKTVVSDRYYHSTYAYQQENLKEVVEDPKQYIAESMEGWVEPPELTILLDLPVHIAEKRTSDGDKYEVSNFQRRVRANYRMMAQDDPNVKVVDATMPKEEVVSAALDLVSKHINE